LVPVDGFDAQVAVGENAAKARFAVFAAGRDAGYFEGKDGFRDFLAASGKASKITEAAARAIIGGHKAAGER
jgi:hypothetical protein